MSTTTPPADSLPVANLAFYRFIPVDDPDALRKRLFDAANEHSAKGSILLAHEGLNAMLAVDREDAPQLIASLRQQPEISDVPIKVSYSQDVPFNKLVVKVKDEIVTMRVDGVDATAKTGHRLPPEAFRDQLRSGEPLCLIDVRNDYECELGTFKGAIDPETKSFNQFPQWVEAHRAEIEGKKILMFCTGGIRCEKASSWMLDHGFSDVYQLDGGVLNYFLSIPDADNDWEGDLFVFDGRVGIDTHSRETDASLCPTCGRPLKDSAGLTHTHLDE